jgi:photosystem II stability/assembly factor-like uncharacterized protein
MEQKMNNVRLIILVVVEIIIVHCNIYSQWSTLQQDPPNLNDVDFVDLNVGFTGGYNRIFKTTDGGKSWLTINHVNGNNILALDFLNSEIGIVVGANSDYEGFLYKTIDGGKTWINLVNPYNSLYNDVVLINDQKGYALQVDGSFWAGTNNLETWQLKHTFSNSTYSIQFIDENVGWVSGEMGHIYKTSNGGDTWIDFTINAPSTYKGLSFINESLGWIVSTDGKVIKTTDGGSSWQTINTSISLPDRIHFLNEQIGFIACWNGIFKTTDGGLTWVQKLNVSSTENRSLKMIDDQNGFYVCTGGQIFKTTSGGNSWFQQKLTAYSDLNFVKFIDSQIKIVFGDNGNYLSTDNSSGIFLSVPVPTYQNLNSFSRTPSAWGICVGDSGTILRSYYLDIWTTITSPTLENLNSVYFVQNDAGWAVGDNGIIIKSASVGQTWQIQESGTTENLNSVYAKGRNNVYVVGDNGVLLRTGDGGTHWNKIDLGITSNLLTIQFINSDIGYIAAEDIFILKTTDGGQSWNSLPTSYGNNFILHFSDANNGIISTIDILAFTTDGGLSWIPTKYITGNLNSIDNYGTTDLSICVGKNGFIILGNPAPIPPVPVELVSFTAVQQSGQIILKWGTATEINNLGFEVQRKIEKDNFQSEWVTIGFKPGAGTSTEPKFYEFIDNPNSSLSELIYYRLKQLDFDGNFEYSNEIKVGVVSLVNYNLFQNYPNPFNPSTKINYSLPVNSFTQIKIYDPLGNEVATLVNEEQPAGVYEVTFNAGDLRAAPLSSGVYYYQLKAGEFVQTRKMLLLK